jgi:hypothetical protein
MWSESFTDSYGQVWSFRRRSGWSTVQLLVVGPAYPRGEEFSYGFAPADLDGLADILEAARGRELLERPSDPEPDDSSDRLAAAELAAGRDPRD